MESPDFCQWYHVFFEDEVGVSDLDALCWSFEPKVTNCSMIENVVEDSRAALAQSVPRTAINPGIVILNPGSTMHSFRRHFDKRHLSS